MENTRDLDAALLNQLRLASVVEASSLAVLVCIAVPLKHLYDWPMAVRAIGPLHGVAFIFYGWTLLKTVGAGLWHRRQVIVLAVCALVPFAGFLAAPYIRRRIEVAPAA